MKTHSKLFKYWYSHAHIMERLSDLKCLFCILKVKVIYLTILTEFTATANIVHALRILSAFNFLSCEAR